MSGLDIHAFLWDVTAFGDVELVAPLVCGVATALWLAGQKRDAKVFFGAFLVCLAAIVAAKLILMVAWRGGPLRSPSGHSAISAYFYGSIGFLLLASSEMLLARAAAVASGALALAIAISRFEIGGHSRSETLVGFAIGAACAFALSRRVTRVTWPGLGTAFVACVAGFVVTGALHWLLAPGYVDEETIWALARWLRGFLRAA